MNAQRQVVMLLAKPYVIDSRVMNEATSMKALGHSVHVICWDRDGRQPSSFRLGGVSVRSLRLVGGKSANRIGYLISGLLLQVYAFFWCIAEPRGRFILHANDFNTLFGGVLVKIARGKQVRLVYDCHEFTPSSFAEWFGSTSIGILAGVLEKRLMRMTDAIITVSPGIGAYLTRETGREITLVANTPRLSQVPTQSKSWWKEKLELGGFVVSFVGYLRYDAALDELVDVARMFKNQGNCDISFVVVGSGPDWVKLENKIRGLDGSFKLLPNVPYPLALGYVRASDLAYAVYRYGGTGSKQASRHWLFGGQEELTMHWKVSEAMACSTCVILRSGTLEWKFVDSIGFGLSAGMGTEQEIFEAIEWAYKNPEGARALAEKGHAYFEKEYNWEQMEEHLRHAYGGTRD